MKRLMVYAALAIGIGITTAILLSVLGHFGIWIFTNSLNTNLFVVGILFSIVAWFSYYSNDEQTRRMPVFTSLTKLGKPIDAGRDTTVFRLLFFAAMATLFCLSYLFLPVISL